MGTLRSRGLAAPFKRFARFALFSLHPLYDPQGEGYGGRKSSVHGWFLPVVTNAKNTLRHTPREPTPVMVSSNGRNWYYWTIGYPQLVGLRVLLLCSLACRSTRKGKRYKGARSVQPVQTVRLALYVTRCVSLWILHG